MVLSWTWSSDRAARLAYGATGGQVFIHGLAGERFAADIEALPRPVVHQLIGYEDDMASVYAAADLLIGRGGASTVHEVAVTGTPSILVPWANAAEDHQTDNVGWLSERGGAILLPETDLDQLSTIIDRLRGDADEMTALGAAAHARGDVHRSGALAALVERVALTSAPS